MTLKSRKEVSKFPKWANENYENQINHFKNQKQPKNYFQNHEFLKKPLSKSQWPYKSFEKVQTLNKPFSKPKTSKIITLKTIYHKVIIFKPNKENFFEGTDAKLIIFKTTNTKVVPDSQNVLFEGRSFEKSTLHSSVCFSRIRDTFVKFYKYSLKNSFISFKVHVNLSTQVAICKIKVFPILWRKWKPFSPNTCEIWRTCLWCD